LIKLANLKEPLSLGLGDHQLEVSRTGYKTVKLPFKVQPGENPPLRVELMRDEKAPPDQSSQPAKYKNSLGMEFALVGKGTAWLGGGGGRPGQRKVEIPYDFYLGVYEVTQEEWQKVTGTNPSWFSRQGQKKDSVKNVTDEELRRFPVENVSWDDAQAFLKQLTKQVSEPGWVYRLPKSIEWEYACRGGPLAIELGYDFHYYFEKPTNELRPDQASYGDSHLGLCKVGSFKPNSLGLYDLHGNVSEWTDDIRDLGDGVSYRVIRGGSCSSLASSVRTASGNWKPLSFRHYTCGLRLARVPVGSEGQIKVSGQGKKPTEEDTEAPEPE
jgi:formylglycine-generating enzyme required for sulfatase activity